MRKQRAFQVLAENVKALLDSHKTIDTQAKLAAKSKIGQSTE